MHPNQNSSISYGLFNKQIINMMFKILPFFFSNKESNKYYKMLLLKANLSNEPFELSETEVFSSLLSVFLAEPLKVQRPINPPR